MPAKRKPLWSRSDFFIRIEHGKFILWNYENHRQYVVEPCELQRLAEYSLGSAPDDSDVDHALSEAGLLASTPPCERWGWDVLSRIFHVGTTHPHALCDIGDETTPLAYAQSYLDYCESIRQEMPAPALVKGGAVVDLPAPDLRGMEEASLWRTLAQRRTCRDFHDRPVSLSTLSTLLHATFGAVPAESTDELAGAQRFGYRRTSPSAGGLQATEPYVWAANVEGLAPGIYHYLSCEHKLEVVRHRLPEQALSAYLCNQHWAEGLAFCVIMTSRFDKMWWKYPHSRAYRPMLMDIGHLSQTLSLCMTACGLQSWMTGYFLDKALNELLCVDEPFESVLFLVGGGHGSGSPYSQEVRHLLSGMGDGR
jgi:SagB-type dehydrogenase family enzyme